MKIYASSVLLFAYNIEEVLRICKDLGYDGVEIWHFHLLKTGESPQHLAQTARQLNLSLSVHALSWDLNFTSKLASVRAASLSMLEESINLAHQLSAPRVVIHPGHITVPKDSVEIYWEYLEEGVSHLAEYANRSQIELSTEIMEPIAKEFFISSEDAARLLRQVQHSNLSITFDAAHVPWQDNPLEELRKTPGVKHLHISDVDENSFHLPLGQGKRDFRPILRYVRDSLPETIIAIEGIEYRRVTELAAQNKEQYDVWFSTLS